MAFFLRGCCSCFFSLLASEREREREKERESAVIHARARGDGARPVGLRERREEEKKGSDNALVFFSTRAKKVKFYDAHHSRFAAKL